MDANTNDNKPEFIQVALSAPEYTVAAGSSVEVVVYLINSSTWGDYFKVTLMGIPPAWIGYAGPPAVWVAAGGQEKAVFTISPPLPAQAASQAYPFRVRVSSQSAPDKGKELEGLLRVALEVKALGTLLLRAEPSEIPAIPGTEVKIQIVLSNLSPQAEFVELLVQGIPSNWVALPSPVISLAGGEEKKVELCLQIPAAPEIRAGALPVKIIAASQKDPTLKAEAEVKLGIAAFESHGRVGVMMGSVQFSTAPGGSLTVPLTILNRGLEADTFRLGIEGIPVSWVSTTTPVNPLRPGENKDISLVIRPPLLSSSRAGRYKFHIIVASQAAPDQAVRVNCILTVTAYMQFKAYLQPEDVETGQPVKVSIKNEGNVQQVFRLTCASTNDQLMFDYLPPETGAQPGGAVSQPPAAETPAGEGAVDPTNLPIPAGESAAFRFSARPGQRQFIGGEVTYPYQVKVDSQQKEAVTLVGRVMGRGLIPVWAAVVALVLVLGLCFTASFLLLRDSSQSNASQTAAAETALAASVSQTLTANQTAAAIAGQQDTDGDGITDQNEPQYQTDPSNWDTDGDQSGDGTEVSLGTNPLNPDSDNDGLVDGAEAPPCPHPMNPDTDQDGMIDSKDLQPCDANNPFLTETAIGSQPTATSIPPTEAPTQPPAQTPAQTPTPPPAVTNPPRFQGMVLFESNRDGNPEIYNTDDAGHIKRMTDHQASDTQAAWRPNMQQIAFTTNRDGNNEIYLINADGTNLINLTNNPGDDQYPSWSIDGEWIAFSSNRDGNNDIFTININTLETRNLTNSPANDTQPDWVRSKTLDASGEFILFTTDREGNQEIYRMRTDGTEAVNLTSNPANDQMAVVSPDG
jgi:uncharacterized membrane protein